MNGVKPKFKVSLAIDEFDDLVHRSVVRALKQIDIVLGKNVADDDIAYALDAALKKRILEINLSRKGTEDAREKIKGGER